MEACVTREGKSASHGSPRLESAPPAPLPNHVPRSSPIQGMFVPMYAHTQLLQDKGGRVQLSSCTVEGWVWNIAQPPTSGPMLKKPRGQTAKAVEGRG